MKKLIVFIFLILLMCCTNLSFIKSFNLEKIFPNAKVEVYIEEELPLEGYKYINNGKGKIVFININELNDFLEEYKVLGYTLKIKNETLNDVFKKLAITNLDVIQGSYYGVSSIFDKKLNSHSNYNFECVKVDDEVYVGTPILLGSY